MITPKLEVLAKMVIERILEVKAIKVLVGKQYKPIDKEDEIIFHIDI